MIDRSEAEQSGGEPGPAGARPTLVTVVYSCQGRTYVVRLDPAQVLIIFLDRERRDEVWGDDADVTVLRNDHDWAALGDLVVEPPEETDEPAHSADCFCFEDDMGRRYCVCGMR